MASQSRLNFAFILVLSGCASFEVGSSSSVSRSVIREAVKDSKNESLSADYRMDRLRRAGLTCSEENKQKDKEIKELKNKNESLVKTIIKLSTVDDTTDRIKYLSVLGIVFFVVVGFGIFKFF